ncbi:MAG: DUF3820 family protein [Candidatus Sericytochromatia bacterium]|nr:DUF3820 family protein [Candidatus Sericytochromatia bacterium]
MNENNKLNDHEFLRKLATTKMPYGKYQNRLLIDLPEPYVVWLNKNALPKGELGNMIGIMYEIKLNGLEYLIRSIK